MARPLRKPNAPRPPGALDLKMSVAYHLGREWKTEGGGLDALPEDAVVISRVLPDAQVAQLVEQRTENPRVGGSIPSLGTT